MFCNKTTMCIQKWMCRFYENSLYARSHQFLLIKRINKTRKSPRERETNSDFSIITYYNIVLKKSVSGAHRFLQLFKYFRTIGIIAENAFERTNMKSSKKHLIQSKIEYVWSETNIKALQNEFFVVVGGCWRMQVHIGKDVRSLTRCTEFDARTRYKVCKKCWLFDKEFASRSDIADWCKNEVFEAPNELCTSA